MWNPETFFCFLVFSLIESHCQEARNGFVSFDTDNKGKVCTTNSSSQEHIETASKPQAYFLLYAVFGKGRTDISSPLRTPKKPWLLVTHLEQEHPDTSRFVVFIDVEYESTELRLLFMLLNPVRIHHLVLKDQFALSILGRKRGFATEIVLEADKYQHLSLSNDIIRSVVSEYESKLTTSDYFDAILATSSSEVNDNAATFQLIHSFLKSKEKIEKYAKFNVFYRAELAGRAADMLTPPTEDEEFLFAISERCTQLLPEMRPPQFPSICGPSSPTTRSPASSPALTSSHSRDSPVSSRTSSPRSASTMRHRSAFARRTSSEHKSLWTSITSTIPTTISHPRSLTSRQSWLSRTLTIVTMFGEMCLQKFGLWWVWWNNEQEMGEHMCGLQGFTFLKIMIYCPTHTTYEKPWCTLSWMHTYLNVVYCCDWAHMQRLLKRFCLS